MSGNVPSNSKKIRIGTRGSPLAMQQSNSVRDLLAHHHSGMTFEIMPIKSAADWKKQDGEVALSEQAGGKGQFATEIENAHLAGQIDCGVHSLKDMPCILPEGLQITHFLPRVDPRDAFIARDYARLEDLPQGAVVGTCSPRRKAWALSLRPDLKVVPFRGNVQTRLDKVRDGQVAATFLAMAGLTRLNITDPMIHPIAVEEMLPACGQGIVCVETATGDYVTQKLIDAVHDVATGFCALAEREVLRILDGSCHTPIAAFATYAGGTLSLRAWVAALEGQEMFHEQHAGECTNITHARRIGASVGQALKARVPDGILQDEV